jgi:hypothetical protein
MAWLENNGREWLIELEQGEYRNPLQVKLSACLAYINDEVDIELLRYEVNFYTGRPKSGLSFLIWK